jgi:multidrug resistance efflux pump
MKHLVLLALLLPVALAGTSVSTTGAEEEETVAVTRVDRARTLSATGRLASRGPTAVRLHPQAYRGEWVVARAAAPGELVRQGQVIVEFERREIELQLDRALFELASAQTALDHRRESYAIAAETTKDELTRMERGVRDAERRRDRWKKDQLAFAKEDARLNDETWQTRIRDQREELEQLERMYGEDELVEATEELVLERTRRALKHRLASYELHKRKRAHHVEHEEARRLEILEFDLAQRERSFARQVAKARMEDRDREIAFIRARRDFADRERGVEKLRADLDGMALKAPHDGILIYGADVTDTNLLRPGDRVDTRQPVARIVNPADLVVQFSAPAAKLLSVKAGQPLEVRPKVEGGATLRGEIDTVGILVTGDHLPVRGRLDLPQPAPGALPGVACDVKVHIGKESVLVVPAAAVTKKDGRATCRILLEDGDEVIVPVRLGDEIEGERVVVLEGLEEGARVILGGETETDEAGK